MPRGPRQDDDEAVRAGRRDRRHRGWALGTARGHRAAQPGVGEVARGPLVVELFVDAKPGVAEADSTLPGRGSEVYCNVVLARSVMIEEFQGMAMCRLLLEACVEEFDAYVCARRTTGRKDNPTNKNYPYKGPNTSRLWRSRRIRPHQQLELREHETIAKCGNSCQ